MPEFYTSVILLINQSEEIGEKQFSSLAPEGAKLGPKCTPLINENWIDGNMFEIREVRATEELIITPNLEANYAPWANNGPSTGVL